VSACSPLGPVGSAFMIVFWLAVVIGIIVVAKRIRRREEKRNS
jgi:hypothetical protein